MGSYNAKQIAIAKAKERTNKERLLKLNPKLNDESGIYFFTRTDEYGFNYAYVGQARHVLTRLSQHIVGYKQHIDLSLQKHKLYDADKNPYGWKVGAINYPISRLDEMEQMWIKSYADNGYQMRNVSLGGQCEGRNMIADTKPAKGYRDGIRQGRKNLAKELSSIISKHLVVMVKPEKAGHKVSEEMYQKFLYLLDEETYKEGKNG